MTDTDILKVALSPFAELGEEDFALSLPCWHTPGKSSVAGLKKGRDAVFGQFGKYGGETNGTFKATLKEVCASVDGRVVGIHQNSGVRNGVKPDMDCCMVFDMVDGQSIAGTEHFFDLHNRDGFWS